MGDNDQLSFPEEDEDLEALRLAALQSLKRKSNNDTQPMNYGIGVKDKQNHFNGSPRGKPKRGKFQRPQQGRIARNGQFNGWTRNTNLIAVPMVTEEENLQENKRPVIEDVPKLVLPQDRYCKLEKSPEKVDNLTSKFDRYDNSDDSESESEEEPCASESEEKPELKRSNSLEMLMAELENEIQGVSSKPEEKIKPKPKRKRKITLSDDDKLAESKPPPVLKENLKPEVEPIKKLPQNSNLRQRKWTAKPRRHNQANFVQQNVVHHQVVPPPPPEVIQPVVTFPPHPVHTFSPYNPMGFDGNIYVPPPPIVFEPPPTQLPPLHVAPPNVYERPLSPITINTDTFSTTTLAPLSPRSAAFVMENRAIVEKRKRRSYSRSPSPARFRRSKSPKRLSLSPRLSKSPKRRSLSPSPVRKVLPPRTNSPKKPPIHDRLGLKSSNKPEPEIEKNKKKEEKKEILDPVMEARRKKFERNEITMTEGVIKLRKQEEVEEMKKELVEDEVEDEDIDEDALLEGEVEDDSIVLDHKIDALFSDEESDSDNEGRFKTKQETNQKVAVLPFMKLINGVKTEVKNDLKLEDKKNVSERSKNDRRKRVRSRSPLKNVAKKIITKSAKRNEKMKQPIGFSSERKIEIKIRNPAKYEKVEEAKSEEKVGRKVEVAKKEIEEVDIGNESMEESANSNINEGDLRAQLSRKRAERQKHPLPDVVPSRLLQNALQGVGFHKGKKAKNKDENIEGKLPIHLRLGAANSPEVFGKKSRKHKNKGSQEQDIISTKSNFS